MSAALCVLAGGAMAADFYVTPAGAGDYGGTNWHNAYSNVQAAANLATTAGDKIFLQWGVYSNSAQISISSAANLSVIGGCKGLSGVGSNDYSGTNSTLTKTGGVMRIVYACDSTAFLAGVTIQGGLLSAGASNGAGVYFTNCVATLTNCVVRDNTNYSSTATFFGGGVYAGGGSLTILDSVFFNNRMAGYSASGVYVYGGAIAAVGCPLTVRGSGCVFSNNMVSTANNLNNACGGAIYITNAPLTLEHAQLVNNTALSWTQGGTLGGALYYAGIGMSATIADCCFVGNAATMDSSRSVCGGAICLAGGTGVVATCAFSNNYAEGPALPQGGGVFADGMQSLLMVSNVFQDNRVEGVGALRGASLAVSNCADTVVENCVIDGAATEIGTAPELVHVCRGGSARFLNTIVRNNKAGRGLCFVGANGSTLGLTNCLIVGNNGSGISFTNGAASLFNCVLARNAGDGLGLAAGTAAVANCTLADNSGWGLSRSGGTGAVVNSIAWGNLSGGVASNENFPVTFSCLQAPASGGTGNRYDDPLFAPVAGCYYLSSNGLPGQTASSPCIDAGSGSAADWGLTNRATCTSGTNDIGVVDLGYHYTNGVTDAVIRTATNCYVDAVNGADTNNGLSWAAAWRTLTKALSNVTADAAINIASGVYNAASGEVFPLTVQMPGLTMAASNADASLAVVDNGGTGGQRVLQATGMRAVAFRGLTFRGGRFTNGANFGAGLFFQACAATLTNCAVLDNTNICTTGTTYGGGVYAGGGSLTLLDTLVSNNALLPDGAIGCGGGVAAMNCQLTVRGSAGIFHGNRVSPFDATGHFYGGAIYADGSDLTLDGVIFRGNGCSTWSSKSSYGGGVYHVGDGVMATITGCRFEGQFAGASPTSAGDGLGGALYLGVSTAMVTGCVFTNNYARASSGKTQGGAVYANGLQSAQLISNAFQKNWVVGGDIHGGAIYIEGCSSTVVDCCAIDAGGIAADTAPESAYVTGGLSARFVNSILRNNSAGRGLYFAGAAGSMLGMANCLILGNNGNGLTFAGVAGSTLGLTNCLIANNNGDGILIPARTAMVINCTLANNAGWGIARPTAAALSVKNSIVWGNSYGGIGNNQNLTLTYTDAQDAWTAGMGAGNFSANPLFADTAGGDYHVMSTAGSWHGGLWTPDARLSPCIDAGDPASPCALEPKPNRGRVNLGAYGNTAEASRSAQGTVISVR